MLTDSVEGLNGSEELSLDDINDALYKYPNSMDLKVQKLKLLSEKDWETTTDDFVERILENDPYNQKAYELISKYYISKNQIEKAFEVATKAENNGANTSSFYELKSLLHNRIGDYTKSIDYINKAILLNRSNFQYYYTKGKIYLNLRDTISAIKFMKRSLSHFKNNFKVLYETSDLYEKSYQFEEAEKLILDAITYAPNVEKLKIKYAEILMGQGKLQQAKIVLWEAFGTNNYNINSALMLSDIFLASYQYDSVIKVSKQILDIDSTNIYALHKSAISYDKKGLLSSSITNYKRVLEQDSLFENAKEEMRKVMSKRAYLQKLKDRRAAMPVFDIVAPKKEIN